MGYKKLIKVINVAYYFNVQYQSLIKILDELKIHFSKDDYFLDRNDFEQLLEYFGRNNNEIEGLFNFKYPELVQKSSKENKLEQISEFFKFQIRNLDFFDYQLTFKFDKVKSIGFGFYTFSKDNLLGIIDKKENVVIDCIYDYIVDYPNKIILCKRKGRRDYKQTFEITVLDSNLKMLTKVDTSDYPISFKSKWARISLSHVDVNNSNHDYETFNYCDQNGNLISKKHFYKASEFSDGFALVYTDTYMRKSGGDWIIGFMDQKLLNEKGEILDLKIKNKQITFNEDNPKFSDGLLKCSEGFLDSNLELRIEFKEIRKKNSLNVESGNFGNFFNGISVFEDRKNCKYGFLFKDGEIKLINSPYKLQWIKNFEPNKNYTLAFVDSTNEFEFNRSFKRIVLISKNGDVFFKLSVFSFQIYYHRDLIISNEVGSKVYLVNSQRDNFNVELIYSFSFCFNSKGNTFPLTYKTGINPIDFLMVYNEFENNYVSHQGVLMNFSTKIKHIFKNNFIRNLYVENCEIFIFLQDYYVMKLFNDEILENGNYQSSYLRKTHLQNGDIDNEGWKTVVWSENPGIFRTWVS
ncbi:hypothetical protein EGI26_14895 [Lacihabitans sp. CCS-44]|uniref:WG repeat-containing protein n=1 Tax=Lacihabitans sp. CCS-44 TaxID=2487331 RepID=UPI0020CEAFFA|nr:WG repeat-containing protein [Lacihabitans sp. CCS-44]MCP9756450.1 hypothetical protein [Lacihabitans sp. CCS-44]